jgi:hypothetical protein
MHFTYWGFTGLIGFNGFTGFFVPIVPFGFNVFFGLIGFLCL